MKQIFVRLIMIVIAGACNSSLADSRSLFEESTLRPNADTPAGYFGSSLAIDGDVMVVGAVRDYERGIDSGSAYIFERDVNGEWIQQLKILPLDTESNDFLGVSVAVSGDLVAVGAVGDAFDQNPEPFSFTGSVYIYKKTETTWEYETKIVAPEEHDGFGMSIALSGDSLFVGAILSKKQVPGGWDTSQGKLCIYKRDFDTKPMWALSQEPIFGYDSKAYFGNAMTMNNDTLMVGAVSHSGFADSGGEGACCYEWDGWCEVMTQSDCRNLYYGDYQGDGSKCDGGPCEWQDYWRENVGATSVLHHDGTDWSSSQSIIPNQAISDDNFGASIAIQDNLAVIGAVGDSAGKFSGAAYVYRNIGGVWEEEAKLLPPEPEYWGAFGLSVAISNNYIIVGSPGKSNTSFTGAVYLFLKKGKDWIQEAKLMASDAMPDAWFGIATEVIDNYLVIGAPGQDYGAGALYFYNLDMIADSDNDGIPDATDNCVEYYNPKQIDCDGNDIGDVCDIIYDPSIDCQPNGILDECELSSCWIDDYCDLGICDYDLNCSGIPDICECLTDLDNSGSTDVADLLFIISFWGKTKQVADPNFDGIVDVADLLMVVGNWGQCLPSACAGNGLIGNYTATLSSPCMGTTIESSDISLSLSLNSSCSVTGTANVYFETPAVTATTWSHSDGILTIGSFTSPVAESATTFETPLEQIFPAVAAAVLAAFDLLSKAERVEIIANCGSPEAYVSGLQMTWTR